MGEEAGKLHPGADGTKTGIRIKGTTKGLKKIINNDLQPAIKMSRQWYLLSSHCKHFLPNSRPAATGRPLCKWPCGTVRPRGPAVAGRWPPERRLRVAPRLEPSCPTDTLSARGHARLCNHGLCNINPAGPAATPTPGCCSGWHPDLPPPGAGVLGRFEAFWGDTSTWGHPFATLSCSCRGGTQVCPCTVPRSLVTPQTQL